jgi:hypothetical protein
MFEVFSTSHVYMPICAYVGSLASSLATHQVVDHPSHQHVHVPRLGSTAKFEWKKSRCRATRNRIDSAAGLGKPLRDSVFEFEVLVIAGIPNERVSEFISAAEKHWTTIGTSKANIRVFAASFNSYAEFWAHEHTLPRRSLSTVHHPDDIKLRLKEMLSRFRDSEAAYVQAGIPYKLVTLLHGPPGTGKSSLIFSLASDLDFENVYVLTVSSTMTDSNFVGLMHSMRPNSVLLLEDADTMVVNRKDKQGINFSTMLNVLDGPLRPHGLVAFLTTNHIEAFDEAMIRHGRVDALVEVPMMTRAEASKMASDGLRRFHPDLAGKVAGDDVAAITVNPAIISTFLFQNRGLFTSKKGTLDELKKLVQDRGRKAKK